MFELLVKLFSKIFLFTGLVKGRNSFEKPLSQAEEDELFAKYYNGDKLAEEKLITHNLRLVAYIAKKYNTYKDQDELISVGSIGLIKALKTFKKDKGINFSTYAGRCIENEILMMFRSQKKYTNEISLEESVGIDKDGNSVSLIDVLCEGEELNVEELVEKKVLLEKVLNVVRNLPDKREQTIIIKRYGLLDGKGESQREVAKSLKISRSYVSRIEKQAIEAIRSEITKKYSTSCGRLTR